MRELNAWQTPNILYYQYIILTWRMLVLHTGAGHDSPTPIHNTPPPSYTIEHLYNHIIIFQHLQVPSLNADVQIISR